MGKEFRLLMVRIATRFHGRVKRIDCRKSFPGHGKPHGGLRDSFLDDDAFLQSYENEQTGDADCANYHGNNLGYYA